MCSGYQAFEPLDYGEEWSSVAINRHGLCADELPLRPDLRLREAERILGMLGCSVVDPRVRAVIALVIANIICAELRAPGTWMFYSRERNYYCARNLPPRYVPAFFGYGAMIRAVAWLERNGFIEHCRTAPSAFAKYRSRMRATPKLLAACRDFEIVSHPKELIILRGSDKRVLDYSDSRDIDRMCRDVHEQNEIIAGTGVRISEACDTRDAYGRRYREIYRPSGFCRPLRRIFNGGWTYGGPWYGASWQNLPKSVRGHLLINGEAVIEIDFRACHLRLLCALANIDLPFTDPDFDPYALPGLPRHHVKRAFSILINAPSERVAVIALEHELSVPAEYAAYLVDEVRQGLPGLERACRPGIGLRLQYHDARICGRVQRELRCKGIPVLSVHDSFIVAQQHADLLRQVMDDEMEVECRRLRRN